MFVTLQNEKSFCCFRQQQLNDRMTMVRSRFSNRLCPSDGQLSKRKTIENSYSFLVHENATEGQSYERCGHVTPRRVGRVEPSHAKDRKRPPSFCTRLLTRYDVSSKRLSYFLTFIEKISH